MSKAEIKPGICGFTTTVEVNKNGMRSCSLTVKSDCSHIQKLGAKLAEIDPFREIDPRGEGPAVFRAAADTLPHPACPVPVGIIKAIEVESGLALPRDVEIKLSK
ncbi:MAG: hypothetical protein U9N73_06075 [Candidatus Auribacterota bacterium]|nr:hypothetical protein [Candidatus Auribacterota bacterium]